MKLKRLMQGSWTVYAVLTEDGNGHLSCELERFLDEIPADYHRNAVAVGQLLEYVSNEGPRKLPDSLSHYVDKNERIWQFTKGKIRILWFYDEGQLVICSHAFLKNTDKTPPAEKSKAIAAKNQYFDAKQSGDLEILD